MSKKKSRSHASVSNIPDVLESREIFFTNLLLLGFEPQEAERRHKIPFNRDMFALPNKKAFEVVMHFLFDRLNPAMAHEKFRDCWPIFDKKQEQAFRKAVSNQLSEISAEDPVANLPRIVPSLFMSPGGDRFYFLLLHFSQYVLYKVIRQENSKRERDMLQRPKLLPSVSHLGHIMLKTTQSATVRHRKRFLERAQLMVLLHREWKQYANELVKEHRQLSKQLRDIEHEIRDCQAASYDQAKARGSPVTMRRRSGGMTTGEQDMHAVKRTQKIQKLRELWKTVDSFYVTQSAERDVVTSVLQEVENKYRLDAGEINVQVPEMLLRECQQELQRRNVGNTYEGGQLNLVTLIQLWNLSLHLYLEKIHQAPMPRFEEYSSELVTQVHTHHAHLANTQAVRSTLINELLPELKTSVSQLRKKVSEGKTPSRKDTLKSFQLSSLGLDLLPPTPPVSFEPAAVRSQDETPTRLPAAGSLKINTSTDTPEAVSMLSETINNDALRHAGLIQGTPTSMLGDLRKQTNGPSKLPIPIGTTYPETTHHRKRVKSAPSKVVPTSTHSSLHTPFRHLGTQATNATQINGTASHKKGVRVGKMERDVTQGYKTQPRKGAESRVSRGMTDHRKEDLIEEKPWRRKKTSKTKVSRHDETSQSLSSHTPVASTIKRDVMSSALRPKTTPRAHQLLVDQIADAVTDGGNITPDFLEMLRTQSKENTPLDLALQDPVAGLDQEAFISKDKLARTPVLDESTLGTPRSMDTPQDRLPKTLFDSDSSPDVPTSQRREPMGATDTHESQEQSPEGHSVHIGNLLDLGSPETQGETSFLPSNRLQNHLLDLDIEVSPDDDQRSFTDHEFDSPLLVRRPELSEDLELTLAEVFQTRTPQLSTRAKTRIAAHKQKEPLPSFKEDDEMTSSTHGTPLTLHRDTDIIEGLTPNLDVIRQDRIMRQKQTRTQQPQAPDPTPSAELSSSKVRQVSGGSQKSVTFSDHVDQQSFNISDFSPDRSNVDMTPPNDHESVDDPYVQAGQPRPSGYSILGMANNGSIEEHRSPEKATNTFLSEVYLTHSPPPQDRPSEGLYASPLQSDLLSDSDLGQDYSMNLSKALDDLLVAISPEITPSRTPKLNARHSSNWMQQQRNSVTPHRDKNSSLVEPSLNQTDDFIKMTSGTSPLLQELSNLHLSRVSGTQSSFTPNRYTPDTSMNFGLLDEDDSILLPTSPALGQGILVDIDSPSM
ncbi:uncharacterized protein LOC117296020 isoform X2 [Asterias rubens]|nr:uncharacterized protein LOC117296020 isoform X2 [Asterias rubens]